MNRSLRRVRICIAIVIAGLLLSGITSFPLESELRWLSHQLHGPTWREIGNSLHLANWIDRVAGAVAATNRDYPFLAYGTDWLAFAHLILAVLFIGVYREPIRNEWIVEFGLIACGGVFLVALAAGPMRGIPIGWRAVDCCFGAVCAVPLLICRAELRAVQQ